MLLGFDGPTLNSMDSVSDRDYLVELLSAMSTVMMHLSRFSEEVIIWNTNEYRFVEIDDAYSTGSSIMPQKKNPDIAELVRGKTGRVYGALTALLTTMKGIPLAYNKDMQEDKEFVFDAIDTTKGCLALFTGMLKTMKFNRGAYGRQREARIHQRHGCGGLSGEPRSAFPRRSRHCRAAGALLHRQGHRAGRYEPGRIQGGLTGI